jgi:eukaryotic-like serine/threonine-protein kinase
MDIPIDRKAINQHPLIDSEVVSEAPTAEVPLLHARSIVAKRYQILSRLGKGGMGEVWHAYDVKLRVDVALKSFRQDTRTNLDAEALRREVRTAREVISPNVCRIFDLVVEEDQELISMEYIDGVTLLAMLIQKGPMEIAEARDIAAQFLAGLEAIHQAGLVHRDLKPENIMVTRSGRVVVMDFGIAKRVTQGANTISGTPPYMSPEQLSGTSIDVRSDVFSAGVVLAEMIHPQGIVTAKTREEIWNAVRKDPIKIADSPWKPVILRAVSYSPQERFSSAGALSRALEEATQRINTIEEKQPYPGLSAFTSDNAQYFFGRELEIESVIKKMNQLHLLALVGPSGAGKTSFLRAGLIPAIPAGWDCIFSVPGDSPILNLGQSLVPKLSGDTEAMQKILRLDDANALWLLNHWRVKHNETLLIIDRFEELFTLNSPEVQSRFAKLIATTALELDIHVLLSMRDDFLLRCHDHEVLFPIFSELTPLSALSGAALRRALVQPALKCGYRFEDEALVDEILSAVEMEQGALPLMAFAASKLWEKRDRDSGLLTREAYGKIGGVAGALAQHAEKTMDRIGTERLPIVREIFRNLITAENTRSVRDRQELLSVFDNRTDAEEVLAMLIDARLLTSFEAMQSDKEKPKRRVEIIHESLLSEWPRLVRWQTQDANGAQLRDQLRQATQLWEQRNRSEDLLWTGTAFLEFQAWRQRYPGRLTSPEEAFAEAMVRQANKKRKKRRIAIVTAFFILVFILIVISSFWRDATIAKQHALKEAAIATAGKILLLGRSQPDAFANTKLAYTLASLEAADNIEARRFALELLSSGPVARVLSNGQKNQLDFIKFSPDATWVATKARAGTNSGPIGAVRLLPWDGSNSLILEEHQPFAWIRNSPDPQFSSDGEFIVWKSTGDRRTVKVWSISKRKIAWTLHFDGETNPFVRNEKVFLLTRTGQPAVGPFDQSKRSQTAIRMWKFDSNDPKTLGIINRYDIENMKIDPTGRWIAYPDSRGVYIRSLQAPSLLEEKLLGTHDSLVSQVDFRPKSEQIASLDKTGEIRFWSMSSESKKPTHVISGKGPLQHMWFDPSGFLLMARHENSLLLFDLAAPEGAEPWAIPNGEEFEEVAVDKNRRWIAILGEAAVGFYPLSHDYPYVFRGNGGSMNVRFTPDGKSLANSFVNSLRLWRMPGEPQAPPRILWEPPQGVLQPMDIDPSGKYILAGTNHAAAPAGVFLISMSDGKVLPMKRCLPGRVYDAVSFSPDGKFAAATGMHPPLENEGIEVWDLTSGNCRVVPQSRGKGSLVAQYSPDGTLFSGDTLGNLYQYDSHDRLKKSWHISSGVVTRIAISEDGHYVAANALTARNIDEVPTSTSTLVLYDVKNNKSLPITTHGNRVFSVAMDPKGTRLITGDMDGIVRVGSIKGDPPYTLMGSGSWIIDVQVDPSGKWIASDEFGGPEVRLWPMPTGTSLDALSYNELIHRLRALTNVRVVADKRSTMGYRIIYEPFPGWEKIPAW